MTDLRAPAVLAVAALIGCADPAEFAMVSIGLEREIPPSVSTLSVFVVDLTRSAIVTSATITPEQGGFLLGVRAEIPLDFVITAWTDAPGPEGLALMPAYAGGARRTIPLGRERERVSVTVRPAGVLTVVVDDPPGSDRQTPVAVALRSDRADERAPSFDAPEPPAGIRRTLVLPTGRYQATASLAAGDDDGPAWAIEGGEGLHVAAEQESVAHLRLVPARTSTSVDDPRSLRLDVGTSTAIAVGGTFDLRVAGLDGAERAVTDPEATVRWRIEASPPGAVSGPRGLDRGEAIGLPVTVPGFSAVTRGTLRVVVEAALPDDRTLRETAIRNLLGAGEAPGAPERLRLVVDAPERLRTGTTLGVEVLDGSGLLARAPGVISLADSDPWLLFEQGPSAALGAGSPGYVSRRVVRSSGPRDLPVILRATFTSTAPPLTLTATQALPVLVLP